ncbi:MAG TPA: hypothetical protein VK689_14060, partial [Armatimonadota bacterium]|nr:hypothetical protein [Armatimonadota bacterium]
RIAAARQDAAFFRSSATRRVLGRAAGDEQLSAEAQQAAQALRAAEPTDWPTLTRHADALMRAIAG